MRKLFAALFGMLAFLAVSGAARAQQAVPMPVGLFCLNVGGTAWIPAGGAAGSCVGSGGGGGSSAPFTPGGTFASLTATASSASVALPAGVSVKLTNVGTTAVSCTLGVGSATATANELIIQAGSTIGVTVGSNTFGACIDQTGSASNLVVLQGGSGLANDSGGGGGGGGSVTQGTSPWVTGVTQWATGVLGAMANYGTSPGAVLVPGVNAFVTNALSVSTWAGGTLGAMANYGTSPGAVLVPGVNAFITNASSISGSPFTGNGGTPLVLTVTGTSASGAIPTGSPTTTAAKIANLGGVAVSCSFGVGSATAVVNQDTIQPGGSIVRGIGSNTWVACIDQTGATSNTVVVQSGTGSASDTSGNPAALSNLGTTPGAVPVPSVNDYIIGSPSYGAVAAALGTIGTQIAISDGGTGCAGGACLITPTALTVGAFGAPSTQVLSVQNNDPCSYAAKSSVKIAITTATTTSMVAVSGSTNVYVCGYDFTISQVVTTANTLKFESGTGAACSTPVVDLTGIYGAGGVTAAAPIHVVSGGNGSSTVFSGGASNAVCAVTAIGATAFFEGVLTYVQQ